MEHPETDYVRAHRRIQKQRGRAAGLDCTNCDKRAVDWCYQYTDLEPLHNYRGTVYSHDPRHYEPMCRECHIAFDRSMDSHLVEAVASRAKACGEGVLRRIAQPGGIEVFSTAGRKAAAKRRKCSSCDLVRSPGVIGIHQKASGHVGYEDLS